MIALRTELSLVDLTRCSWAVDVPEHVTSSDPEIESY